MKSIIFLFLVLSDHKIVSNLDVKSKNYVFSIALFYTQIRTKMKYNTQFK